MAEAGLYIGWGAPTRGREKHALDVFSESMQYYGRLQQEGKLENVEVAILTPTGGDVGGFFLLRGTAQQVDSLRRDEEFQDLLNRVQMIADGLRITDAIVDEGIAQQISRFDKVVGQLA
jgi:hypothetical protein